MELKGPNMKHLDLPGLADFIAVATYGGLNAAGRATEVPKATISRRVGELETALGTRLLERGGRRLRLTEEGQLLLDRAGPLLRELREIREEVSGRAGIPRGPLRISVPSLFARDRLGGFASGFVARYPEVALDIDIDDGFVDPVRDGYDLVVRVNPVADSGLVGKCFLRTDMVLAAPPEMPMPEGVGQEIDAIVLSAQSGLTVWTVLGAEGEIRVVPRKVIQCSSMMVVHDAATSGAGAALLPLWLIEDDLQQGRLKLWGKMPNRQIEAWALHTSARLTSPKVRAFVDALVDAYRR
jgi:DNA-binding transcriptional LysR family regulator